MAGGNEAEGLSCKRQREGETCTLCELKCEVLALTRGGHEVAH